MKSRQEIDAELVRSAQAGNVEAFESLMKRYRSRLIRYLSTYMMDAGDTEDVVQETFIKVFKAIDSFRGDASFSTWLFRIGINTAKRSLTRNGRRLALTVEPSSEAHGNQQAFETATDYETPEAKLENKQILDLLDSALADLPTGQRTSLILREIEGLSYEEIAEQMHCPVGTVRSRIHRARDTIAAVLRSR